MYYFERCYSKDGRIRH